MGTRETVNVNVTSVPDIDGCKRVIDTSVDCSANILNFRIYVGFKVGMAMSPIIQSQIK